MSSKQLKKLVKKYAKSYAAHYSKAGPQGPAGSPGPAGANGVVTGYHDESAGSLGSLTTLTGDTKLAAINLPAGSYLLRAKTGVSISSSSGTQFGYINCSLKNTIGTILDIAQFGGQTPLFGPESTLSLHAAVTIPSAGSEVSLHCAPGGLGQGADVSAYTEASSIQAIPTTANVSP